MYVARSLKVLSGRLAVYLSLRIACAALSAGITRLHPYFTIPAFLRAMLSRLLRLALNAASDSGMVGVSPKNDFSASVVHFTRV